MHLGGFSGSERARYRTAIYRNVVESGQAIAEYIQSAGLTCSEEDNQVRVTFILSQSNIEINVLPAFRSCSK